MNRTNIVLTPAALRRLGVHPTSVKPDSVITAKISPDGFADAIQLDGKHIGDSICMNRYDGAYLKDS